MVSFPEKSKKKKKIKSVENFTLEQISEFFF